MEKALRKKIIAFIIFFLIVCHFKYTKHQKYLVNLQSRNRDISNLQSRFWRYNLDDATHHKVDNSSTKLKNYEFHSRLADENEIDIEYFTEKEHEEEHEKEHKENHDYYYDNTYPRVNSKYYLINYPYWFLKYMYKMYHKYYKNIENTRPFYNSTTDSWAHPKLYAPWQCCSDCQKKHSYHHCLDFVKCAKYC